MEDLEYTEDGLYIRDDETDEVIVQLEDDISLMPDIEDYLRNYLWDLE